MEAAYVNQAWSRRTHSGDPWVENLSPFQPRSWPRSWLHGPSQLSRVHPPKASQRVAARGVEIMVGRHPATVRYSTPSQATGRTKFPPRLSSPSSAGFVSLPSAVKPRGSPHAFSRNASCPLPPPSPCAGGWTESKPIFACLGLSHDSTVDVSPVVVCKLIISPDGASIG